jgi:AmiR/NasT family two-component response regulator
MKDAIDANGDNVISQDEINRAVKILEQAKKQENQREAFNMLRQYSMLTSSA